MAQLNITLSKPLVIGTSRSKRYSLKCIPTAAALVAAAMAEMVVNGVSTPKVTKVMETLCGTSVSKSAVSKVCKALSQEVDTF